MSSRILVVDDEKLVRWGLRQALEGAGYQVDEAGTGQQAMDAAAHDAPDLVLLEHRLPDQVGIEVVRSLRRAEIGAPIVMFNTQTSVGGAAEAVKAGVYDCIEKPFEIEDVLRTVGRALEAGRLRAEVARRREVDYRDARLDNVVAESPKMREVVRLVRRLASGPASDILVLGENGVGKGLVARALHFEGVSWDKPLQALTCSALPEAQLEKELFGCEKGATTEGQARRKGVFELADGGTVFLDEIDDLSLALQDKLLRVLQEQSFRRVGGSRDMRVAVRVIAATHRALELEVQAGRFRRDLLARLGAVAVSIPPLRQRSADILPLARRFVQHFNAELRKTVGGIDLAATEVMQRYPWPGNVRELRNAIERAVLLTDGPMVSVRDLPAELGEGSRPRQDVAGAGVTPGFALPPDGVVLEEIERDLLRQALQRTRGNRTRAARLLGINRDRLRYRIHKFHMQDFFSAED